MKVGGRPPASWPAQIRSKHTRVERSPDFSAPANYMPPIELPKISPPKILNDQGKEIEIRGWRGGHWNFDYGFTAKVFESAIRDYFKGKDPNIDVVQINGIIPSMGIVSRDTKKGETERCLFIPERLLEQDPGLNGLNDDAPFFSQRRLEAAPLFSREKLDSLFSIVRADKRWQVRSRERMLKALQIKYRPDLSRNNKTCEAISIPLHSTKQWVSQLLSRAEEKFRQHYASARIIINMQIALSVLISWLAEKTGYVDVATVKISLMELGLVKGGEEDYALSWLSLVDKIAPNGLRYIACPKHLLEDHSLWKDLAGPGLIFINGSHTKTTHFEIDTVNINIEKNPRARKEILPLPARDRVVQLLLKRGPLHFRDAARLLRAREIFVQKEVWANDELILVGRGILGLAQDHPGINDVPSPPIRRRSYCFAAVYLVLSKTTKPLSIPEIHEKLLREGFGWTGSAIRNILVRDSAHRDHFRQENGKFSLNSVTSG